MKLCCQVLIVCLLAACLQAQTVDCIRYINNTYGTPQTCTSTTDANRPINVTAVVKATKTTTWYGPEAWTPYLVRDNKLIYDLSALSSCFEAEPPKQSWVSGRTYEFSVKCVLLPTTLIKGDLVYFRLFEDSHHKDLLVFLIPIPGYSEPLEEETAAKLKIELGEQSQSLRQEAINLAA